MALFLGQHINKIDAKGRISIPAAFRNKLLAGSESAFVAFPSRRNKALECWSMERMEKLSASIDHLDVFSEAQDHWATSVFAEATEIPFDKEGRLMLPKSLAEYAEIHEQAVFVGMGPSFQLWNPQSFALHRQQAMEKIKENAVAAPLNFAQGMVSHTGGSCG
ncbi:MAG: division/cell wall cluster transcriptional repressor MraZ [Alphaproteobacteria bacterium]